MDEYWLRLGASLAIGLLIGLERERNPAALAGVRTFALLALFGSLATLLAEGSDSAWIVAVGLAAVAATLIAAYAKQPQHDDPGTTTVVAACVCYLLGALAGAGETAIAGALGIVVTALLYFKVEIEHFSIALKRHEQVSLLQFLVASFIVLPLLPDRGFGPYEAFNPRHVWLMVVLISGIGLASYVALRVAGERHGVVLTGILGGAVSSTATTVLYARRSGDSEPTRRLAAVVVPLANLVPLVRILLLAAVLAPSMLRLLAPLAAAALAAGLAVTALAMRRDGGGQAAPAPESRNPAELGTALRFAALYAVVLMAAAWLSDVAGSSGLYAAAAASGTVDIDAIVLSALNLFSGERLAAHQAMMAIAIAYAVNVGFKLCIVIWYDRRLALRVAAPLAATVLGGAAFLLAPLARAAEPAIESELVLITPVGKSFSDAALAEFAKQAKARWGVTVKTSALAAGTPIAYGRIVEWNGRPQADLFWGGESALFDRLAAQKLLAPLGLPKALADTLPATLGAPKPVALKDPGGYWVGTVLETCGIAYHPRLLERLGVPPPKDWDDLLDARLKGQVAQAPPTRSSSSHAAYEVILQRDGDDKGWAWLKRLAGNTGFFAPRSRDVPAVVAKGEFAVGFSVPSYMAFEERLAGFDIRYVAPKTAWITAGPAAILAGAKHPNAARAFVEFLLSERGQRIAIERGLFPIVPRYRIQGAPGSTAEMAVAFNGGVRSIYDAEVVSVYDDELAQKRYEEVNARYRREIEKVSGTFSAVSPRADAGEPQDLDSAYEAVVAARKALQEAQAARDAGAEPREGERQGTAAGRSRLNEEYWQRQRQLEDRVEEAQKQLDRALARWQQLK